VVGVEVKVKVSMKVTMGVVVGEGEVVAMGVVM